ncbi:CHRD domain-containing protein [Quisquiliibacterium transsilvanicum]|uniref:CHRD domain-containing protein n=1 Tax=Quisquiliibacterium transsilvanicum TaxID=1549638 RepID=A0A7W8HLZ3_9BURK|nr:CHRD domain-containing protein [Quisquiliibacterium transsilvanicum]MBB5273548.1 hypothetical protein [Quisquiliibacterium transsilvanicum]
MKPSSLVAALAATVPLLLATPAAHAAVFVYEAALSGPNEQPPNASPGTGWATVTYDDTALTMRVEAQFSGLLGVVTAAHIHCCTVVPMTGTAGVATTTPTFTGFPSGVTAGSYDETFDLTLASSFNPAYLTASGGTPGSATAALFTGVAEGRAYFNIHTNLFLAGEIRGFLRPSSVPEPGSLALFALGATALLGAAGRRRGLRADPPAG